MIQAGKLDTTSLKANEPIQIEGDMIELSDGIILIQDKYDSKPLDLYTLSLEE